MKKNTVQLLTLLFLILAGGCTKEKAEYFRKIESNGWYEFVGRFPVNKEIALKTGCYHFTYNEQGKLSGWEYLRGGKPDTDPALGISSIRIEYTEGSEKRIFLGIKGNPVTNSDKVYSIVLTRNEKNYPLSEKNYNKNGKPMLDKNGVAEYVFTPDKEGRIDRSIRKDMAGNRISDVNNV